MFEDHVFTTFSAKTVLFVTHIGPSPQWIYQVFISLEKMVSKRPCFRYVQDIHCHGKILMPFVSLTKRVLILTIILTVFQYFGF
jgi:hypothetical protein